MLHFSLLACCALIAMLLFPTRSENAAHKGEIRTTLSALLDEDLADLQARSPIGASMDGERSFDALLPDVSPQAHLRFIERSRNRLAKLRSIDRDQLTSAEDRISYDLLEYELGLRIESAHFNTWQTPVTQLWGPHISLPQIPLQMTFTTEQHIRDYVQRLKAIPAYLQQIESNMRAGMEAGRVPPRVIMGDSWRIPASIASEENMDDPLRLPMASPFDEWNTACTDELRQEGLAVMRNDVLPAFRRLAMFMRDEYIPACRDSIAARESVDGIEAYEHQIRVMTTLDLSAQEIHEIGLAEVTGIRAEMMEVIRRSDFMQIAAASVVADEDELFRAFTEYLRTDPKFYFESAEELLDGYRAIAKRVDPELPTLIRTLPRLPYGVREMPAFMAPTSPTAYYYPGSLANGVPGYFIANTHRLDQRPRYEMIALTLHEAVPGHHIQNAIVLELEGSGIHTWRTKQHYTAFGEGWALYSERLGLEMESGPRGMYTDPYDDFGRLSYEMWRAMRLVVDTGIHAFGWSREQAIEYMMNNSALTKTNIEAEVDRYISWPAQALGYKLGELEIRRLRSLAEERLGEHFDLRDFHDQLLWSGSLPLPVLERKIHDWIERTE
ncbi:MAG: DUF885 domain-containing protein [Phycisphaerales bacterium JB050]